MGNAIKDWGRLLRQCFEYSPCNRVHSDLLIVVSLYRFTAPGGYTELLDLDVLWRSPDNTMRPDSTCAKINAEFLKASRAAGFEPSPGPFLEGYLKTAGFTDVEVKKYNVPIGPWALDPHMVSNEVPRLMGCRFCLYA